MAAASALSLENVRRRSGILGGKTCITLLWGMIVMANGGLPPGGASALHAESPAILSPSPLFFQERVSREMLLNDGVWTRAEFVGWDSRGLRFDTEEESGVFEAGGFISWGQSSVMPRQPLLLLVDGSVVAGQITSWDATEVTLVSNLWGELTVPRDSVRGGLLKPLAGLKGRAGQLGTLSKDRPLDRIWVDGGDWLEVEALQLIKSEGQLTEYEVRLQGSQRVLKVAVDRVWGISSGRLSEAESEKGPSDRWRWVFDDGTVLYVRSWEQREDALEIALTSGIKLRSSPANAGTLAARLRGASTVPTGAVDLLIARPLQQGQVGWIGQDWAATQKRRPEGGWMQIAGEVYQNGLGVVGGNTRVYSLPEGTGRLRVWVGMDDSSPVDAAEVKIFVADRNGEWVKAAIWQARLLRGDRPGGGEVEFDAPGIRTIAINVQTPIKVGPSPLVDWLQVLALPASVE